MKTDSTGAVKCRYWYYPYGESWNPTCSEKDARKFTDKERDPESGLDYFGARYYASTHGRFTSVDPALGSGRLEDPQTWNRYLYVRNNPTRYLDPNGEDTLDSVLGFVNGLTSSVAFNIGRVDAETQNEDFAIGQTVGDATATAAGLVVTGFGLTLLGGEGAVTVASGGVALPVTAPAAVVTVAGTALGATAAVNGAANTGKGLSNLIFRKGQKGGGKTGRKVNEKRVDSAKKNIEKMKRELSELDRKPNKTKEIKERIDRLRAQIKREEGRMRKSEEHARRKQ